MSKFSKVQTTVKAQPKPSSLSIESAKVASVALEIVGTAPIIQNCFSQKAVEQMLRKHMGFSVQREAKKPSECIEAATIRNINGDVCVPPTGLKLAMISAAGQIKSLKKTQLRTGLYVVGQSLPLSYSEMVPRMDMTRTSGQARTPDVRFRPEFRDWSLRAIIEFSDILNVQTVVDLVNRAGAVGLCEWRPEKNGTFGTFRVSRAIDTQKEINEVRKACSVPLVALRIPDWALDADIDPELLRKIAGQQQGEEEDEAAE